MDPLLLKEFWYLNSSYVLVICVCRVVDGEMRFWFQVWLEVKVLSFVPVLAV